MPGPLEFDSGSEINRMRGSFPTNSRPKMTQAPGRFELLLSKSRARVITVGVFGTFAVLLGLGAWALASGVKESGFAWFVGGLGVVAVLALIFLSLAATDYQLIVDRNGIQYRKGKLVRRVPASQIREVRYGEVLERDVHPTEGWDRREQLEVALNSGAVWWLIVGDGGRYMVPLALAIGGLCGVPVRNMGKVKGSGKVVGLAPDSGLGLEPQRN